MSSDQSQSRKPLHEYRRPITQEERDIAAKLLARNASLRGIQEALGCGYARCKRIVNELDVLEQANKLRMTAHVPDALDRIVKSQCAMMDMLQTLDSAVVALERNMRQMNKAIHLEKIGRSKLRERNRTLREEIKQMRDLMRRRGVG